MIANLTAWFALHVLFTRLATVQAGPLRLSLPDPASLDWRAALLALIAAALVFRAKWGVMPVLAISALGGLALGHL